MKAMKRNSVKIYVALAIAGLVILNLWPTLVAAMPLTARHNLERAWRLTADVGQYSYQSTVVQTDHPTLTLGNVGRTARSEQFTIEGQLDRPADLMTMNIGAANQTPLEVKVEQGQSYGRMRGVEGMDEWTEVETGSDLFAPGGDPLGFLNVVENVQQVGHNTSSINTESEFFPAEMLPVTLTDSMTRYQFDVSGPKYAQHMRASLEEMLRERGELPARMSLQTPQQYLDLTGQGEIWISDNGLPLRQIIRLEFPPEPGADVWIEAEIITNFSNWEEPGLTYAFLQAIPRLIDDPSLLTNDPLSLVPTLHSPLARLQPDDLQAFGVLLGLGLLLIALGVMAVTHRRSPKFYAGLSISMIIMMLVTPLLQSHQTHAAATRFYARQAEAEQQHAETTAQTEAAAPTFNPNQNPLAKDSPPANPLPEGEGITASPPKGGIEGGLIPAHIPLLQGSPCTITATSDCDGDGLTDNVEIYELGTRIDLIDSDSDGISDKTEVAPFRVNGQTWYLDPLNADSNGDGLTDGAECLGRTDVVTTTLLTPLEATCTDTDTDGIPDVHDFDDDGDGVPDSSDTAHLDSQTVLSQTFNLNISGATANKNLFVDFQIRPTDERHLWWTNSALNWPDRDTSGQIMRNTPDTLAPDGDMIMMPMLEIVIPYSAANPAGGLPISGTTTITATTPISTWIDTDVVSKYNMTVMGGANGERVAYLPLNVVTDSNGGMPIAWQARMPYKLASGVSNWGAAHQVKMIWLISGQTDRCDTGCSDPTNWTSQSTVLQTYYDDFVVTGIQVQEHHGAEALMVRQDNRTGHYEPELWHLADTMQYTYLDAQTVSGNRLRLNDISSTYGSWGLSGLSFNYIGGLTDDAALLEATTGDAVPAFLRSGGNPADGTVASVLLLGEETRRTRTMGDVDLSINNSNIIDRFSFANNTFTVDLGSASLQTDAAMRIQPYKFSTGTGWATESIETFLPALKTRLETVFTPIVMTNLLAGDTVTDPARAKDGAILLAINTYFGLSIPTVSVLVNDGTLISGQPLVNNNHQRPSEPVAATVQRLVTNLKTFFGIRNLNDLNIPTVDSSKSAGVAPSWSALAASRGAILESFGDVLQGNAISSEALALLEIANYPNTIDTTNLVDSSIYAIMDYVMRDFVSGTVVPFLSGQLPPESTGQRCSSITCIGSVSVVSGYYVVNTLRVNFRANYKRMEAFKPALQGIKASRENIAFYSKSNPLYLNQARENLVRNQAILKKAVTTQMKIFAWSGVAIQLVTSGATIAIVLATGQIDTDAPAFSRLVAEQISAVLTEVLLAVLYLYALSTGNFILLTVLAIIAVIDTIIAVVCEFTGANRNETVARWICGGITGAITQGLAYVINDTTPLVDLTRDDRLQMVINTPVIGNESGLDGVIVGNSVTFSGDITNTLYMDDPNWIGYSYGWQWSDNNLDDATFAYKFQPSQQNIPLELRQVNWDSVPGKRPYSISANDARFRKQFTIQPLTYNLTTPGINQGADFQFSEGFAVRQQNCWLIPVPLPPFAVPTCWLSKFDSTSHNSMNNQFIFDVLPGTVDEFRTVVSVDRDGYRLAWDNQFPVLADADGDGLRSQARGGVDPDDSNPDTDADGLSDYFEMSVAGYDPLQADTDCDGLTDYWEAFYRTNPALADSDGDGLGDSDEFLHPNRLHPYENGQLANLNAPPCASNGAAYTGGWEIVYDFDHNGNPLSTWVNANPLDPDSDDDSLSDAQERIYAYNPNVASSLNVLRLDSQIQTDSGVMPFVSPGGTISYTAKITNELRIPYARGVLEAELPLDNRLRFQPTGVIAPGASVTVNGNLGVSEARLTRSGAVDMGLRAGAIIDDPTGRVLWLHLNEAAGSTTFIDDSFLDNNATCTGNSCPTANGTSLTFDGNDSLVVSDSDDLDLSQYTIALAVNPPVVSSSSQMLLAKTSINGQQQNYNLALTNGKVQFSTFNGCTTNGLNILETPVLPVNAWSHITATYDGSMKRLYVDGVQVASIAYSGTPCQNNHPVSIGAVNGGSLPFTGKLDEIEIFPIALTQGTILSRYAAPSVRIDMRNGITWGSNAVSCTGASCPTAGGNGATFDQSDYLSVTAPNLASNQFSFATWIKPQDRTTPMTNEVGTQYGYQQIHRDWQGVFGSTVYDNTETNWPFSKTIYPSLFVSNDGALRMMMANNSATCQVTTRDINVVQKDTWQHVAVIYNGSTFTFYINGEPTASALDVSNCLGVTPPNVATMYVGRPNNYGYAWLDRIYMSSVTESGGFGNTDGVIGINRNTDDSSGYIWALAMLLPETRDIKQTFLVRDTPEWLRVYEDDVISRFDWRSSYDASEDDNLLHLTNLKSSSYVGLKPYEIDYRVQDPFGEESAYGTFYFGVYNDYFDGELDDFRAYNYALSSDTISDIFNDSSVALDVPFDEAPGLTVFADDSGRFTSVSCSGNTCPTSGIPGRLNQAIEFDGVNDYLTIGSTASEVGFTQGSFSAMMWINPHSFRGTFNNGQVPLITVGNNYRLWLGRPGRMQVWRDSNAITVPEARSLFDDTNRWYHLAYTFERTSADYGIYRFYVNGALVHEQGYLAPIDGAIQIGRGSGTYYDGLMDDLTIVRRTLSQEEVEAHMTRSPAVNLHLDEDLSLTSFTDDSQNRYTATCTNCPQAGDKGQIREAVTFDGSDLLTLAGTANIIELTDFSLGLWVKPTKTLSATQWLMLRSDNNQRNANFRLSLPNNSLNVRFDRQSFCSDNDTNWHTVDATNPLLEDQWNHVVATHDSVKGEMRIYINGSPAGTTSSIGSNVCTQPRYPIKLGQGFYGGMDEVSITEAVLSGGAVRDTYNYQASWFDVINSHTIFVDAEPPTVDLTLTPSHLSTAQTVLYIGAQDASSPITKVEYRINNGAWQDASPSIPDGSNSQGWLFSFQQAAGSHTIEARATDTVGNVSNIASAVVQVDGQGPTLTLNTTNNPVRGLTSQPFNGTVSDSGSGVDDNNITLTTVDHTGANVSGNQPATVNGNTWQATQPFLTSPYGLYTTTVRAADRVGNTSTASGVIKLDGLPPYADVTEAANYLANASGKTITGVASDVPYPSSGRTLHLHFESGSGLWVDGSDTGFVMQCSSPNCPTTGVTGKRGNAITFDGVNDQLAFTTVAPVTTTTTAEQLGLSGGSFTAMSWVKADSWSGDQAILGSGPNSASDDFYLGLRNGQPLLSHDSDTTVMSGAIPTSEWVHVAWRFDAASGERAFFVNGTLGFTSTGHSVFSATNTIQVGQMKGSNAFAGSLDELVIYAQPLTDETIYDIANPLDVGISSVELRIRSYANRDIGQFEGNWNSVALNSNNALYTTWDYTLPNLAKGTYKIDLRVTDGVGNSNFVDGAWDMAVVSPDVVVSKQSDVTLAQTSATISYTISYTNASLAPATGVIINEVVPVDTTFDPTLSHPNWSCLPDASAGSTCTFAVGNMAAGASDVLSFTVTVTDSWSAGTASIANTVTIATDGVDGTPTNNTYNHQIPIDGGVDLIVSIVDDGTAFQYDPSGNAPPMIYTISYTNSGTQPAQPGLRIEWSAGGTVGPAGVSGWSCNKERNSYGRLDLCTRPLNTLDIGQSGVVTFPLKTSFFIRSDQLVTTTVAIEDLAGATEVITANNRATEVTPIDIQYALLADQTNLIVQEGQTITNGAQLLNPTGQPEEFAAWPSTGEFVRRTFTELTWQWVYTTTDGPDETQPVTWNVFVGDGGAFLNTVISMTVQNVAPTVAITGNDTVASGTPYNLSLGSVVDPGNDTVTACSLDWGDSSPNVDCLSSLGGGSLSHTYGSSFGQPTITVNLTDEDGTHVAASKTITITGLNVNLTVNQPSVTVYESQTATNSGTYSPADASLAWLASEGTISNTNGIWTWSLPPGSAEGTRPVTITAGSQTVNFNVTVNGDGVASNIEVGAPNSGDGNNDGMLDQAQMNVASLPSPLTNAYVTLVASPGMTLTNVSLTATPSAGNGSQPAGMQFPLGYLDFDLTGMGTGGNANVTLLISGTTNINSYAQYDATNGWTTFLYDNPTQTGAEIVSNQRVILYFLDGSRGDGDGSANGTVANLGGPVSQQQPKTLTINVSGSGSVSPAAGDYTQDSVLTMQATADPGWRFDSWSGALSGSTISQSLTMNQDKSVTAIFIQENYTLVDQVVGQGSISISPDQNSYVYGDVVTVTATANLGWRFSGWSGDLSGSTANRMLTIDGNKSITATFTKETYTVSTNVNGNGRIAVTPDQNNYDYNQPITVQALPEPGYTFQGWSGDLSGNASFENLKIDGNKSITALFATAAYSVETSALGSGNIALTPAKSSYSYGEVVTATATADPGWSFNQWVVGLSGMTATQSFTVTGDTTLLGQFTANEYTLIAGWSGNGGVSVNPNQGTFGYGQVATVTAQADPNWIFNGWSGDISSNQLSTPVTITGNTNVTANFIPVTYTLTVAKDGTGQGKVTTVGAVIDCGSDCSESLDYGTVISLTAVPEPGNTFIGWRGEAGQSSDNPFTVTVTSDTVVTATFRGAPVNDKPDLATISDQTVDEGQLVTFTATATDTDVPTQTLTYSLSNGPSGAVIGNNSGLFSWLTDETDGPGSYTTTVVVSDGVISDSQVVSLTVNEVNQAPVLTAISNQSTVEGNTISFTAVATDTDVPTQTLTYSLSGEPAGATINSNSGAFNWVTNNVGVFTPNIQVSDGVITTSQTVTLTVTASNVAPVLGAIGNQTVDEGATISFTAVATDTDMPTQMLTYSLSDEPSGATINSSSGAFSWSTTEADGPSVYTPTIIVSDGVISDSETINITVNEVNVAPVLAAIGDQTVTEGNTVSFTAVATDTDIPSQTLSYSLSGEPAGAMIDSYSGVFSWLTDENDGPGVYSATIIVSDDVLTDSQTIQITVNEETTAPVLDPIGPQTITETQALTFTANAVDPDNDALTYGLYNASSGMRIDSSTGEFSWTPTEAQGPAAYFFSVMVTDTTGLTDTTVAMVNVTELNQAPVLDAIAAQTLPKTQPFSLTVVATDADYPANGLSYTMLNAPTGATLDETSGLFSWTPDDTQGPAVYTITFVVTDDGTPVLSDTQDVIFTVTNNPGVLITESDGSTDVAFGGYDTYEMVLITQPTDTVTVTMSTDGQVETIPTRLIFTPDNWDEPQMVTTNAMDDIIYEGPHTGLISHNVSSADLGYDGIGIASVTVNIADDTEDLPVISIGDVMVDENVGTATVPVTLTGESVFATEVSFTVSDGTALGSGVDYDATNGTLTWAANTSGTQTISLTIVDDSLEEPAETINVALTNVVSGTIGDGNGVVTIKANDELVPEPLLSITKDVITENDPVKPGDMITYTIVVLNSGQGVAEDVTVQDTLPAYLSGADLDQTVTVSANEEIAFTVVGTVDSNIPVGLTTITNTASFSHSLSDGQATATIVVSKTVEPEPSNLLYLSARRNGSVDGLSYADEDILVYDPDADTWAKLFDGSDVGYRGADIDAFTILEDGSLLLSADRNRNLPDVGRVDDSDIVRFIPTSLGENTVGTFEWYFDASDVRLTRGGEDVDAISVTSEGKLLISTIGSFRVAGIGGRDEDLILFTPTSLGENTSGTWERYFDGSDVGLRSWREDVRGGQIDEATGDIYLTTDRRFDVPGLEGEGTDIFICSPDSLGVNTECEFSLYWAGEEYGFDRDIDAFAIGGEVAVEVTATTIALADIEEPDSPEEEDRAEDDEDNEDDSDEVHALDDTSLGVEAGTTTLFLPIVIQQ